MNIKIPQSLSDVSETLLMTLYIRASESQRTNAFIKDEAAAAMIKKIDYDFSRFRILHRHDEIALIMRVKKFDDHVQNFMKRAPDGVVVNIGCGLDTRYLRVDNGTIEWFDLDMPDVISLRQELIPTENRHYHALAMSVFDDGWFSEVGRYKPRPTLFIAEGVLPYFEEGQVKSLFLKLRDHFPGCELVCDAHTPFVIWADNLHLKFVKVKARMHWSVKSGKEVETWGEGIRLLDGWNYYEKDSDLNMYRWLRIFPFIAKSSGIYHYRLESKKLSAEDIKNQSADDK